MQRPDVEPGLGEEYARIVERGRVEERRRVEDGGLELRGIDVARAGVMVMALTAEMIIDAAMVSANCR